MENTERDLLEEPSVTLVPASMLKRLANYLVDVFVFSMIVSVLLFFLAPANPLTVKIMKREPFDFKDQLLLTFCYGLYMSVIEALLKGKSLGKLITGTRAVTEAGLPINSQDAFLRGLLRMVPFDQLSAISLSFGPSYPWHDRWSKTFVADENKSQLPKP